MAEARACLESSRSKWKLTCLEKSACKKEGGCDVRWTRRKEGSYVDSLGGIKYASPGP